MTTPHRSSPPRPSSPHGPTPHDGGPLQALGRWIHDFFAVLEPCRWSVVLTLVGVIAFLVVDQGQDSLRRLAESRKFLWFAGLTSAAVWAWTLSVWYWARTVLCLDHWVTSPGLRAWTPRVLGVIGWVGWSLALLRASMAYAYVENGSHAKGNLFWLGVFSLLMTAAFLFLVITRRHMFRLADVRAQSKHLDGSQRWIVGVTLVAATLMLVVFTAAPVSVAPALGAAAIVFITFAVWTFFGTATVLLGKRLGLPIVTLGLGLTFLFSYWNDNHAMPTIENSASLVARRPTVKAKLDRWLPESGPIFVVVAEGGGIRAAYWTGIVLGALHDQTAGRFSRHLFAQSTVSGGSLGSGVYTALVAEQAAGHIDDSLRDRAKAVIGRDFLSPVLGMMLAPDAFQRLLPFPVAIFDRSRGLERGWEAGWEDAVATDRLTRGLLDLGTAKRPLNVPSLVLNTTHVGTGMPWYMSDLDLGDAESGDLLATLERDLPLSGAIHNSARFLYVSPAGTFRAANNSGNEEPLQRVVDGGYFENFGATRATRLVQEIVRTCPACQERIVVIAITNGEPSAPATDRAANELLAPIRTLLRTRSARGELSLEALCRQVDGPSVTGPCRTKPLTQRAQPPRFFQFGLCAKGQIEGRLRSLPLPLGWDLSHVAQHAMDRQLDPPPATAEALCGKHQRNLDSLAAIKSLLQTPSTTNSNQAPSPEPLAETTHSP